LEEEYTPSDQGQRLRLIERRLARSETAARRGREQLLGIESRSLALAQEQLQQK